MLSCSRTLVQEKSETTLDSLFKHSFEAFQALRLEKGMYRDARLFEGTDFHPISIATTEMGLMAFCIDKKWDGFKMVLLKLRKPFALY